MSDEVSPIDCGTIVYRAILKSGWLDPDRHHPKAIKSDAFFRRRPNVVNGVRNPRDADGLSVAKASEMKPQEVCEGFDRCFGVASLHVGRLRDLGVEVARDPDDPKKLLLTNLPYETPEDPKLEKLVGDVAKTARIILI